MSHNTTFETKTDLTKRSKNFYEKCNENVSTYLRENRNNRIKFQGNSRYKNTSEEVYTSLLQRVGECSLDFKKNDLTPIPYKSNRKMKNKLEKKNLIKARKSAVEMRKIEYSNFIRGKSGLPVDGKSLFSIPISSSSKRLFDSTKMSLETNRPRNVYNEKSIKGILLIQSCFRRYLIKKKFTNKVVNTDNFMIDSSVKFKNVGVQVSLNRKLRGWNSAEVSFDNQLKKAYGFDRKKIRVRFYSGIEEPSAQSEKTLSSVKSILKCIKKRGSRYDDKCVLKPEISLSYVCDKKAKVKSNKKIPKPTTRRSSLLLKPRAINNSWNYITKSNLTDIAAKITTLYILRIQRHYRKYKASKNSTLRTSFSKKTLKKKTLPDWLKDIRVVSKRKVYKTSKKPRSYKTLFKKPIVPVNYCDKERLDKKELAKGIKELQRKRMFELGSDKNEKAKGYFLIMNDIRRRIVFKTRYDVFEKLICYYDIKKILDKKKEEEKLKIEIPLVKEEESQPTNIYSVKSKEVPLPIPFEEHENILSYNEEQDAIDIHSKGKGNNTQKRIETFGASPNKKFKLIFNSDESENEKDKLLIKTTLNNKKTRNLVDNNSSQSKIDALISKFEKTSGSNFNFGKFEHSNNPLYASHKNIKKKELLRDTTIDNEF